MSLALLLDILELYRQNPEHITHANSFKLSLGCRIHHFMGIINECIQNFHMNADYQNLFYFILCTCVFVCLVSSTYTKQNK